MIELTACCRDFWFSWPYSTQPRTSRIYKNLSGYNLDYSAVLPLLSAYHRHAACSEVSSVITLETSPPNTAQELAARGWIASFQYNLICNDRKFIFILTQDFSASPLTIAARWKESLAAVAEYLYERLPSLKSCRMAQVLNREAHLQQCNIQLLLVNKLLWARPPFYEFLLVFNFIKKSHTSK